MAITLQDVYSGVAEEVQLIAEQDAQKGVLEAQALLGNINRKLVKQTVMTSVYGVTGVGAREQIQVCPSHISRTRFYSAYAKLLPLRAQYSGTLLKIFASLARPLPAYKSEKDSVDIFCWLCCPL